MQRIGCPLCGTDRDVTICPACSRRLQASLSEPRALPPGLEQLAEAFIDVAEEFRIHAPLLLSEDIMIESRMIAARQELRAVLRGGRAVPSPPLVEQKDDLARGGTIDSSQAVVPRRNDGDR